MKIKFWGTAAGLAERDRYCTSMRIEVGGEYYILDFGAPVEYLIAKEGMDLSSIRAGFVTHMHSDHVDGLPSFAKLYAQFSTFIFAPASVDVYLPSGIDAFYAWMRALNLDMCDRLRLHPIREGEIFNNGKLRVTAIRTEHLGKDKPSYAFTFEAEGKRVLFSGDITADFHDFPRSLPCDLIVCELAHGRIDALTSCLSGVGCRRVIFNHMTTDPKLVSKVGVDRIKLLEEKKDALPFSYQLAYDGLEIEV